MTQRPCPYCQKRIDTRRLRDPGFVVFLISGLVLLLHAALVVSLPYDDMSVRDAFVFAFGSIAAIAIDLLVFALARDAWRRSHEPSCRYAAKVLDGPRGQPVGDLTRWALHRVGGPAHRRGGHLFDQPSEET